jgi:HAD superfamily hydrolase (TIGR01509 family)
VEEFIKGLHVEGVKLAILTNGGTAQFDRPAEFAALKPLFATIITAHDVERSKPHPEGIEKILTQLELTPEDALMVGDTERDILAGQTAGLDTALYLPDQNAASYQDKDIAQLDPTYTFRSFAELKSLIFV